MEKENFRYDSRYQSLKKQNMQEAIEFILEKDYGDTITNASLGKILGYNLEDEKERMRFLSMMGRIKNFIIDYGYVLKTISGVGYYILKPQHISNHCFRNYIRKGQRILDKSDRILSHVDTSYLQGDRNTEYEEICNLNDDLIRKTEEIIENSDYNQNKDKYNTIED